MECKKHAMALDLIDSVDAYDEEPLFEGALAHLKRCRNCRQVLDRRLAAEELIRDLLEEGAVMPDTLIPKLLAQTGRKKSRIKSISVMAASVLLFFSLGLFTMSRVENQSQTEALKQLHLYSIRNHQISSSPQFVSKSGSKVEKWLSGNLNRPVRLPKNIRMAHITGASKEALGSQTVGAVDLEIDGKRSTLFTYDPSTFRIDNLKNRPKSLYEEGYTVAVWEEDGLGYSLVSEAPVEAVNASFGLTGGK